MKKNPIFRTAEESEQISCGNVITELSENSMALEAVNGAGFWQTVVSTVLQGTVGCLVSYGVGNGGYVCTWSYECSKGCRER
ncbi:MAG: plantaricin C family lantibiotic [Ruminococcus sp.]|nr:plantaricin C family lantibiotic [Ruminococcus sp.]MBE6856936.1 plantaricin C family lantibiotic [Ruminococcus sp.]